MKSKYFTVNATYFYDDCGTPVADYRLKVNSDAVKNPIEIRVVDIAHNKRLEPIAIADFPSAEKFAKKLDNVMIKKGLVLKKFNGEYMEHYHGRAITNRNRSMCANTDFSVSDEIASIRF